MTSPRKPWQFRARARGLGIPDAVSSYVLDAIRDETAVPVMLRHAALIGTIQNLRPRGLAAQVRKLLSWDYRRCPGDYMSDPKDEPIHIYQEDVRAAILSHDAGPVYDVSENISPAAARTYLDKHADRAWAAHAYQYGYALPSYGTSYDSCGQLKASVCLEHDGKPAIKISPWRCRRLSCPICYEQSIEHAARRAADRLFAGALLRRSAVYDRRRRFIFHHFVVSVHPSHYGQLRTPKSVDAYRASILRHMRWLGYRGGVVVYHPWRFTALLDRPYFSPHFHFIASGFVDRSRYLARHGRAIMRGEMEDHPITEVHRRTGGDAYVKVADTASYREVYSMVAYLLTHAGQRIAERSADREQADGLADADDRHDDAAGRQPKTDRRNAGQAVVYFGDVAPNKFETKAVLTHNREMGSDIRKMVSAWEDRPAGRSLSGASVQTVECQPAADEPWERCGSVFSANLREVAYDDPEDVPVDELAAHLLTLAIYGDNAPQAKSTGGRGLPDHADWKEPYRYAVVRLNYTQEKYGRGRVGSKYAVIALDPSTEPLCMECGAVLRVGVRTDDAGIPPPDNDHPAGMQYADGDAEDWEYYDPRGRHAGMGVPYYAEDGSPRWDVGVPTMPADIRTMPVEYQLHLRGLADEQVTKYVVAAMRRGDRDVDVDLARRAVRRHLAYAGHPDKSQQGWEEVLVANAWGEYAMMVDPMLRPPAQTVLPGDGHGQ